MASYLVLTPPGAPRYDDKTRFVADRFSWLAFLFPAIWLLIQRQWLAGITVLVLQGLGTIATSTPGTLLAGLLFELALRLLIALEGPAFVARILESKGWTLRSVIAADDLRTAELIYGHAEGEPGETKSFETRQPLPASRADAVASPGARPAFGLFGTYGER